MAISQENSAACSVVNDVGRDYYVWASEFNTPLHPIRWANGHASVIGQLATIADSIDNDGFFASELTVEQAGVELIYGRSERLDFTSNYWEMVSRLHELHDDDRIIVLNNLATAVVKLSEVAIVPGTEDALAKGLLFYNWLEVIQHMTGSEQDRYIRRLMLKLPKPARFHKIKLANS